MIIPAVTGFNPYQNTTKYDFQSRAKINSLQTDTFQLQKKFSPSFGSAIDAIDIENINKRLGEFSNQIKGAKKIDTLRKTAKRILLKINALIRTEAENYQLRPNEVGRVKIAFDRVVYSTPGSLKKTYSKDEIAIQQDIITEISNRCYYTESLISPYSEKTIKESYKLKDEFAYLEFMQKRLQELLEFTKFTIGKYSTIKRLTEESTQNVPLQDILNMLKKIETPEAPIKVSLTGLDSLGNTNVEDPVPVYKYVSHLLSDITRFTKENPIDIGLEKVGEDICISFKSQILGPAPNPNPRESFPWIFEFLKNHPCRDDSVLLEIQGDNIHLRAPLIELN